MPKKNVIILSFVAIVLLIFFSQTLPHQLPITNAITPPLKPIRGMFYYPWFPETWANKKLTPFTHYHPQLGYYSASNEAVISQQIKAMQYAGIDVGIFEWNGKDTLIDQRVPLLLRAAQGTGFHWAVYYDQEGLSVGFGPNPAPADISSDLSYINQTYANDPSYEHINGRPVVFVYGDSKDDCGMADRWREGNKNINDYIVLKVFKDYTSCTNQPDGWHQYNPQIQEDYQKSYSFTISPGFWKAGESNPRLPRDTAAFTKSVRDMVASHAPLQLITSFNEWGEGSAVENGTDWKSSSGYGTYLDILHTILVENK